MKWRRKKARGRDVIDIRGAGPRGGSPGSGPGLPIPGGLAGIGGGAGLLAVLAVLAITVLGGGSGGGFALDDFFAPGAGAPGAERASPIPPEQDPQRDLLEFSDYVFNDAQRTWAATFERSGDAYRRAQLVVYDGAVRTDGCGGATSAVGPFYCPADGRVYLDLTFYEDMRRELGAGGDFAWAYVIAHEVGHHVQGLTGAAEQVARLEREQPERANELSVRLELQADCYAGVWAATVFAAGDLERGDLEEAIGASEAVGDDRLQSGAGRRVDPDSFTHGSSEQRRAWFETGYRGGDPAACDTFAPETV